MKTTKETDAVLSYFRERFGDLDNCWPKLTMEMNRLSGYGEVCNTTTLEEGLMYVYRSLVSKGMIKP